MASPRRPHRPKIVKANGTEPASGVAPAVPQDAPAPPAEPPCAHASAEETDAHAVLIVRQQQCAIIRACCAQAAQGSYLHAKFVFEFAGIAPRADASSEARERSLAEELLARLDDEEFCRAVLADAPPLSG